MLARRNDHRRRSSDPGIRGQAGRPASGAARPHPRQTGVTDHGRPDRPGHWRHQRDRLRHHLHHHRWPGHHRTGPPALFAAAVVIALGRPDALDLPRGRGVPDGLVDPPAPALPQPHRRVALEHRQADRGRDRCSAPRWGRCWPGSSSGPTCPGGAFWAVLVVIPLGIPGLRGQLRLAGHLPGLRRFLGGRAGHDLGRLPPGLPARRRQHAQCRPCAGGGGPKPRSRPVDHLLEGDGRAGSPGHPRWLGAGGAGMPGRVRRLRDPRLPHPHDRGVHGVQRGLRHLGRVRVLPDPRGHRRHPLGGGGRGPGQGPCLADRLGRLTCAATASAGTRHRCRCSPS